MLKRQEVIERMVTDNIRQTATGIYEMFVLMYPELSESDEARFSVAEYMIRKAFITNAYDSANEGALARFCNQFYLNDADIEVATRRTQEDLGTSDFPEVEIAITATFIWFSQAIQVYGDYMEEFLYFIYALVEPCRGDENLKQRGAAHLARQITEKPALLSKVIAFMAR